MAGQKHFFINTPGAYLHVKDEMFVVRTKTKDADGNLIENKSPISPAKAQIFLLSDTASFSTAAVKLAIQHHIEIVMLDSSGHPYARIWHSRPGSTTAIRKKQLAYSIGPQGLFFVKEWIAEKMENQRQLLIKYAHDHKNLEKELKSAAFKIEQQKEKLLAIQGADAQAVRGTIMGLEGTAGRVYFEALAWISPQKFEGRSKRPAKDAFNAVLNYLYGMLYSRIEKVILIAGLDPYIGFLHRDDYNQLSFVYDFIEPFRVYADEMAIMLFSSKEIDWQEHFNVIEGAYYMNKEGKQKIQEVFIKYMEDAKIKYAGRNQTRSNILQARAHEVAAKLKPNAAEYEQTETDSEVI